jgi:hypothetical protein
MFWHQSTREYELNLRYYELLGWYGLLYEVIVVYTVI